jgi:hypothetical protein
MYVLGIVLMFGGCGASCGMTLLQSSARVERMQRLVMPGEHEVELTAGSYVLYAETRSAVDGKSYVWHGGSLECAVGNRASEQPAPIHAATTSENYAFGGFAGQSMFDVEIATTGRYLVTCKVERGGPMVMALSHGRVLGSMFYSMLGGFVVAAAGLTTILLTWDKRRKHRVV